MGAARIEVKEELLRSVGDFSGQLREDLLAPQFLGRVLVAGVDDLYRHLGLLILAIKHDDEIVLRELARRVLGGDLVIERLLLTRDDIHRRIEDIGFFLRI